MESSASVIQEVLNASDELPNLMESLDHITIQSDSSSNSSTPSPARNVETGGRTLRNRTTSSLTDSLHKVKNRTISKPRKLNAATIGADASEKLIKKLYLNKKMTKLKPTNLETIFETPKEGKNGEQTWSTIRFKRSIDFKTTPKVPKQVVQMRRKMIKKMLGRKAQKPNKISMEKFMEYFSKLQEEGRDSGEDLKA